MRTLVKTRRVVQEVVPAPRRVFRGKLAEDYDGIGQYILVSLASSSVGGAYKARIASADFGTGQSMPRGTPVAIFSNRGQLEILSMGSK